MFALIGLGPNDVQIPSLIFNNKDEALSHLLPLIGPPKSLEKLSWNVSDILGEEPDQEIAKQFYTEYYPGCGDCYRFILKEIQPGQPFVSWNLD